MRRRLDLAISFIMAPPVLFLDEPTTGMDPRHRMEVWNGVRRLVAQGTTVLLTTHYLDEADQLADSVTVIDRGRAIAQGAPAELKARLGGNQLDVAVRHTADLPAAERILASIAGAVPEVRPEVLRLAVPAGDGVDVLAAIVPAFAAAGIGIVDIGIRRPTLDEVFVGLTGQPAGEEVVA
jgi:ABC-2 type transport system ATP-binding protein